MAETILLDTTIASLLHPRKQNSKERFLYEPHLKGKVLALSFQSVAEIYEWAQNNNWSKDKQVGLAAFIAQFLVIPYDDQLARTWATIRCESRRHGRRLEAGDCWIADTAVCYELTLLTHDRDFLHLPVLGLDVVSCLDER